MHKNINILTDWWWEILIYPFEAYLKNIKIERLNKWILWKKSFDWGDFKNALYMRKYENNYNFDVIHYNNWVDPIVCKFPKDKITIYESHSIHIWLNFNKTIIDIESKIKKIICFFIYPFYKIIFYYKINKVNIYYTSIPSVLPYAKKIRKDAIWLPNVVDFNLFWIVNDKLNLDKNYINIFLPTSIRKRKNQIKSWEIINNFSKKYNNLRLYVVNHPSSNYDSIDKYIKKFKNNIIWVPLIPREKLPIYYNSDWNIVFWSLYKHDDYAMLNMIELEAMACKCPIIATDSFEIIKISYENIEKLAWKVLEDNNYKNYYVNRNYDYVKKYHSIENVSKIYFENLKKYF